MTSTEPCTNYEAFEPFAAWPLASTHDFMTGPACHRDLRRFWFPLSTGLGIGVTASSEQEARQLAEDARARYFADATFMGVIPDVDIDALDQNHILPNAGPVVVRGVWYPRLNL